MTFLLHLNIKTNKYICRSNKDNKSIFSIHPNKNPSISHVRSIYDNCSKLPTKTKENMYKSYFIDGEAVEKYIDIVEKLENTLNPQSLHKQNIDEIRSRLIAFATNHSLIYVMMMVDFIFCRIRYCLKI
jgi:hypothetical protein